MSDSHALTPKELKEISEIQADRDAAKATFTIAMDYHSNQSAANSKKEREWWMEVAATRDIDLHESTWSIDPAKAIISILKTDE
jgi:hypothetical protein